MITYTPGELVFVLFPFVDSTGAKRRPALVLLDTGDDDIVVARVTGQIPQSSYDVSLANWQQAGLRIPSVARLHKLATLEKQLVERKLGSLSPDDWLQVIAGIRRLWSSI